MRGQLRLGLALLHHMLWAAGLLAEEGRTPAASSGGATAHVGQLRRAAQVLRRILRRLDSGSGDIMSETEAEKGEGNELRSVSGWDFTS